ncbi:unnamed protein product [Toxocara canis]|uniref:Tctex1 domain-containing protein 2 n=1 Tax=Toxocara canis TaxID=6265 RepID=A0A183U4X5_TOXCA|nr:unnamed protein product [Toxocara canis]
MDIAEEYCLCVEKWITVNQTSNFSRSAGQYIADAINSILKEKKLDHLCEKLQLKEVLKEEKHESQTVVRMKISTVPSGIFEAQLRYDDGQYHIASDVSAQQ